MKQAENCTARRMSATPCADCFSFDAVLLVGEGEGGVVYAKEDGNGVVGGAEDVAVAAEGDVAETERG